MARIGASLFIGILVSAAFARSVQAADARLDMRAQWQPDSHTLQQVRMSCPNVSFPALGECFARNMQRYGASPEAIAFMHSLNNEAYLHIFVAAGKVDEAFVTYPFRANTNEGCLLVNGVPAQIDVDKLSDLPQAAMKRDRTYETLAAANPNISLWPGDRSDRSTLTAGTSAEGGQRFLVEYLLLNGCHACARLGTARFAFDFDADGKFTGVTFVAVRPIAAP